MLVTGASGFIGRRAIAPLLERGYEVHAVARGEPPEEATEAQWHRCDLAGSGGPALAAKVRATHLLHFAWYAEHGRYWSAPENLDWVGASLALVRAFREAGGSRIVAAGTCAEYDWSGPCCSPETPLAPATLYGTAKDALRRVLEAYARESGLSFAWGRIFFVYGPHEQPSRLIAAVARAVLDGESIGTTHGRQLRDLLYVDDVASAFAAVLHSGVDGSLDVGSGVGTALADVVLRLQELAGREGLVRLGAIPLTNEPTALVADTEVLARDVGWLPSVELDDGLRRTLCWWQERLSGTRHTAA